MHMTAEGLALIKRFEGFRSAAYRDAVGVLTIGYGHTAMAGAPAVRMGDVISEVEATRILARDVDMFAKGVARLLARDVSAQQFSALVSFAYNVGLGNFGRSSVLRAVNGGAFDAVPRRLQLWVKAGGRVLPGLVKRRAAEAALFAGPDQTMASPVAAIAGKRVQDSTTNLAAIISAIAGIAITLATTVRDMSDILSIPAPALAAILVILAATAWIIRERALKARDEGV